MSRDIDLYYILQRLKTLLIYGVVLVVGCLSIYYLSLSFSSTFMFIGFMLGLLSTFSVGIYIVFKKKVHYPGEAMVKLRDIVLDIIVTERILFIAIALLLAFGFAYSKELLDTSMGFITGLIAGLLPAIPTISLLCEILKSRTIKRLRNVDVVNRGYEGKEVT